MITSQIKELPMDGGMDSIMNTIISNADSFVRKQYFSELMDARIAPLSPTLMGTGIGKNVRLFKIMSLAYGYTDDVYKKISDIYNALSGFDVSQVLILDSNGYDISLYLGVACKKVEKLSMQFDTFRGSFLGSFPGGKISVLNAEKNESLLHSIFDEPGIRIASVSALAAAREQPGNSIYGIERLVDGMYGKPFTMILLADSMPKHELGALRQSLEAMYTELSPYRNYAVSINAGESGSYTESFNLTKSESLTEGTSITENMTFGTSKSKSVASQPTQKEEQKDKAVNQLAGTAASLAAIMSGLGGGGIGLLQGLFYGGSISNIIGSAQTLISGGEGMETETTSNGENYSISFSEAETTSRQKGFSASKGLSGSNTKSMGKTIQMNYENKPIIKLLDILDQQIIRLQHIEEIGGFNCAAYFVTGDHTTALMAANMYRSLLGSGDSLGQSSAINVWSEKKDIEGLGEYLKRLYHPVFHFEEKIGYPTFTAASLVASDEIPMYTSLPQCSIRGLPVTTHAEFARDVMGSQNNPEDQIEIGYIYHMGKKENARLGLSKNNLRGHMFVAGTTGMGKSNFCYGILGSLYHSNVKFMVVEPAKGEYHRVFGGLPDVRTFGTNPNLTPLLKINPFAFPDGIHVNEHIDRVLEIFNSCWPMYAAMPAVLKQGMERIYKNCGYNLVTGVSREKRRFPTFTDLLKVLPEVIRSSEFSGEVKGNYIGSLVTRVASLTNGLYGCIFSEDEIEARVLFDENVLIDLSRVGSSETKALLMGLLVMKLQEYRMSASKMNMPLNHVTVLEEAHHLLKADSGSSAEGVHLRAMSLEMIANAIAEMRTYGEGFVIADQSPALMDLSVIRNTNTKVVFKLPEKSDRQVVGSAMSLSPEQIDEIARLECGVAVVYQSNWDNPVLSEIDYYDSERFTPYVNITVIPEVDYHDIRSQLLAIILRDRLKGGRESSADRGRCSRIIRYSEYANDDVKGLIEKIRLFSDTGECHLGFAEICRYIDRLIDSRAMVEQCGDLSDIKQWHEKAEEYVAELADLSGDEINELILLCINIQANDSKEMKQFYFREFANINNSTEEKEGRDYGF